jgi:hypothetical protein
VHPKCILDGGAQVIVIKKDIWEHLDLLLLTEKIMIMESANNMCNHTLGVIQNVKMTFGPIILMLQIQVIEDSLFKVLLGQPFFVLANCITEDNPKEYSCITLHDLNTSKRVKFVMYPCCPQPPLVLPMPWTGESKSDFH